jgi:hypothetical protein
VVEKVEEEPFYGVIKTAGHLQAPLGNEVMVVATSAGVLYYTQPSLVEGQAVGEGKAFAAISAKELQDGDPLLKTKLAYETAKAEYERAERLVGDSQLSCCHTRNRASSTVLRGNFKRRSSSSTIWEPTRAWPL